MIPFGWHWQYGWLRRPELDMASPSSFAYERPDGAIAYSSVPDHRDCAMLAVENCLASSSDAKFIRAKATQR